MNEAFRGYVTSTAFSLSLSRNMVDYLAYRQWPFSADHEGIVYSSWAHSTNWALRRRGLITGGGGGHLTDEGRLVLKLCVLAELVKEPGDQESHETLDKVVGAE